MSCQPVTILVVDDDAMVRNVAATAFEAFGCLVLEAEDGDRALAQVATHPEIALLFANRDIAGMNGVDLAVAARALRPELKVALTFAASGEAGLPSDLPVVPKPWTIANLKALVQPMLAQASGKAVLGRSKWLRG